MAPPVCVDVTKDGVKDVLLNAFDGNITMFNGENLTVIWQAKFPGFESYRSVLCTTVLQGISCIRFEDNSKL